MHINNTDRNKRIAKNLFALYIRIGITMVISLYTSRVVLSTLGVVDYGIYNVVGGLVAMFGFVSTSLSGAISRFINYELGKGSKERLKIIFSTSINIQLIIASIIFILAEIIGIWFLNTKMVIPLDRIYPANWVLQCSIFTFIVNIISVPYNATIIAHEHMKAFAYISILEVTLKLVIVYFLTLSSIDRLILYSVLLLIVSIFVRFIYSYYCSKNFEECYYSFHIEKKLTKDMFSFAGWNFIGTFSGVLRTQGVNIIINLFCGPIINATNAIANQVYNAFQQFISSFTTAINPQITQSYAAGNIDYCISLLLKGTRFSYFLILIISLPFLIETDFILTLWLKTPPDNSSIFVRLTIVLSMISILSTTLVRLILSTGNIRNYQIVIGSLILANLPISYSLIKWFNMPAEGTIVVAIIIEFISMFLRLIMVNRIIHINIKKFISNVLGNAILVTFISLTFPLLLCYYLPSSSYRFILVCFVCILISSISIIFIGCSKSERQLIFGKVRSIIIRKSKSK